MPNKLKTEAVMNFALGEYSQQRGVAFGKVAPSSGSFLPLCNLLHKNIGQGGGTDIRYKPQAHEMLN